MVTIFIEAAMLLITAVTGGSAPPKHPGDELKPPVVIEQIEIERAIEQDNGS